MRAAIVLGGGRSARMGTDKLALRIDGATLLARTCEAAATWADRLVVAGHEQPGVPAHFVLEDPPFGGPVAGLAAALDELAGDAAEALLLAGDLAAPLEVVRRLAAAELGPDGVVLEDDEGWPQFLAGRYRVAALEGAVAAAGDVRDLSVRRLLRGLTLTRVPAPPSATADIDTPAQASRWRAEG